MAFLETVSKGYEYKAAKTTMNRAMLEIIQAFRGVSFGGVSLGQSLCMLPRG